MKKDLVLTPLVALFVAFTCSAFGGKQTTCPAPNPAVTVTATSAPAPTVTVTSSPLPAPTVTFTVIPEPAPTVTATVTSSPLPAPTVTVTSSPLPAVTVTALPLPAPTVTVTATPLCPQPSPSPSVIPSPSPKPSPSASPSPSPIPSPSITPAPSSTPTLSDLSAIWVNEGGDKVAKEETRATTTPSSVLNSVWDGNQIKIFGAKNETVSFNLVIEAAKKSAPGVSVSFSQLTGPNGAVISGLPSTGDGVFDYTKRDIELFYIRYLPIKGLSHFMAESYDERHWPKKLRRPWTGSGIGSGKWTDRPDHDKSYPDIAVPLDIVPPFLIAQGQNQSVWADIYIPKTVPAGLYTGTIAISESGFSVAQIPVSLTVRSFTLPDVPSAKTMLYVGQSDIANRYVGNKWPNPGSTQMTQAMQITDRHFQMAHRHRISLIDSNDGNPGATADQPAKEWLPRLSGSLFSSAKGYRGPGEGVANSIFSVGTYGSWDWQSQGQAGMNTHSNAWADWFKLNAPGVDFFLYLIDESDNFTQTEQWASWLTANPGSGKGLAGMATLALPDAMKSTSDLAIPTSTMSVGDTTTWQTAWNQIQAQPGKRFWMYNGKHPASGSFMTDDDGVALRELAWGQYKRKIDRWFYWDATYYNDYQSGRGETDVFTTAQTFGPKGVADASLGLSSGTYSNGDGVLFYPGTDKSFPASSYGLNGPIASLRLKHWRRGLQDFDYMKLASAIDPAKVDALVNSVVGKILWDNGVADPNDPSWIRCDLGWSENPDDYEAVRSKLADIIEGK